jgi:zinc-binding alcohol dehydrogenase family protein
MTELMRAVVTTTDLAHPLELKEVPVPEVGAHDLLVRVAAVGVNPVDGKQRTANVQAKTGQVLGFDGVGEVLAIGNGVTKFSVGDRVYYAGQLGRFGSNAELEALNEDIVALAPDVPDAEAAAVPLTFLTAFELLHDKFGVEMTQDGQAGKEILIINGAGGVGSSMIQLAKWLGMTVIATASRPETVAWVTELGADVVVNHREDYATQLLADGHKDLPYIAILHTTEPHIGPAAKLVGPFGHVGAVVEPTEPLDVAIMKNKSASLDWEFMFAKVNYNFDVASQGAALRLAAELINAGKYRSPLTVEMSGLEADVLVEAQDRVTAGDVMGKLSVIF